MPDNTHENNYLYSQGIANLGLEGLSFSKEQDHIVKRYKSGQITKNDLIKEAIVYARSYWSLTNSLRISSFSIRKMRIKYAHIWHILTIVVYYNYIVKEVIMQIHNEEASRRRPVNLTIREDLLKEAKELNLNASKAAESGIIVAIQKAQEDLWLEQNKKAIESYNRDIEERGLLLKPSWLKDK